MNRLLPRLAVFGLATAFAACTGAEAPAEDASSDDGPPDASSQPLLQPANFQEEAPERFRIRFATTAGEFVVDVHRAWATRGADRVFNLVRAGFYDGVPIHRVIEGFVADFGIHPDPWVNAAWRQATIRDDPVRESNARGRVSFSKSGPDRRTVQIFVNLRDNPSLDDEGFSPFGEVVEGMDVVDALHSGYGDGPPRGEGVYQAMAIARGAEYFAEFPLLDVIDRATIEN
ncbi:MAG: peptidylprolyl isomerase [Gemmatimonadetes bacterium]|nr:peptidylprolyl isomerase [Gemmatimonadota bacterium]NNK62707.1 peptidylprolyl isomerase [Gemmatimonadota bacterium]